MASEELIPDSRVCKARKYCWGAKDGSSGATINLYRRGGRGMGIDTGPIEGIVAGDPMQLTHDVKVQLLHAAGFFGERSSAGELECVITGDGIIIGHINFHRARMAMDHGIHGGVFFTVDFENAEFIFPQMPKYRLRSWEMQPPTYRPR